METGRYGWKDVWMDALTRSSCNMLVGFNSCLSKVAQNHD